jgi:hypothetical protein
LELDEEVIANMATKIADIRDRQFAQRKQLNATLLKLKLQLVDITSDHQKQVKCLQREREAKKQEMQKRLQLFEAATREKIAELRNSRAKTEALLLRRL